MSDQTYQTGDGTILQKYRDMGDGTHAPVVFVGGGGGGGGGGGSSDTTEATQLSVLAAAERIDADIGAPADAVATSDTGTFSLIAFVKRSLQNWTTLLGRIPASVSGRTPVDGSGVTQPVRDTTGSGAVRYTTNTVAVTGATFSQIMCLTNTTFAELTRTGATGSLVGVALPAGTLLVGPVTAYTLTSGAVAAYA